jgi:hypothetical protein
MLHRRWIVLAAWLGASSLAGAPGCGARSIFDVPPDQVDSSAASSSGSGVGGAATAASTGAGAGGCAMTSGPSLLASDAVGPFDIVADDTHAYWANENTGTVSKVSLCDGTVTKLATGELSPFAIAVDATHVYWSNLPATGGLRRAGLDGSGPVTLWSGGQIEGIAVDAGAVYWTVVAGIKDAERGIWSMSKGGGPATQLYSGQVERALAVDDTSVYFSAGLLTKIKKTGGLPLVLAKIQALGAIALDATNVYVATWEDVANVVRVPKAGGPMKVIAAGDGGPNAGVAVANGEAAWTSESGNAVLWAPAGGGPAVTLATGQPTPERIATGGGWFVWANYNGGSIWRAPVP